MTTSTGEVFPELSAQLASGAFAGTWALDPARSTVGLRSRSMWGLLPVNGVFGEVEGEGTVTADGQVTGRVAVKTASVNTRLRMRDGHLRSKDFFACDTYPVITFALSTAAAGDAGMTVSGTLTVRDQSQPLTFPSTVTRLGDGELCFDAEVMIDRSDFGLTFNMMNMSSMQNAITIHAVFIRS